jgi:hypothetical protein
MWRLVCDMRHANDYRTKIDLRWKPYQVFDTSHAAAILCSVLIYTTNSMLLGIAPDFRDYFTASVRGHLYRFSGLPR